MTEPDAFGSKARKSIMGPGRAELGGTARQVIKLRPRPACRYSEGPQLAWKPSY